MKRSLVWLWLGAVACGDNRHDARVIVDIGPDAPAYGRAPFPTDAMREVLHLGRIAGLDAIAEQHSDLIALHLEQLDGFGLRPVVEFFVQGALDPDTVPLTTGALTDALVVLDVDPATAEMGAPLAFEWRYIPERDVIAGAPAMGVQLREGTRYAAVVTEGVRGDNGEPVYGADALVRLEDDPPQRWRTTAEAYRELRALPELSGRIAGLAVFTTQRASDALVKARNQIANTDAVIPPTLTFTDPALIFDTQAELTALLGQAARQTGGPRDGLERWGGDNPTGIAHDHIAVIATGTTTTPRFRGDDCVDAATGCTPDGPGDETFTLGPGGVPKLFTPRDAPLPIPITIVLPKGPVPAAGFPVVVFGHGLGGSRHDVLAIAEPLAAQGYAIVAIDMWGHGSRFNAVDVGNNLGGKPDFTGDRALRDGFGDDTGGAYLDFFESFLNIGAIRDTIRQSTLDIARVAQLVQHEPSLAALAGPYGTTPRLDPKRVAYLGQSFGTIVGVNLSAIEPSISLYVLNVPGGGLVDHILVNSAAIGDLALPFAAALYRASGRLDKFHPLVGALQAIFDGADSLTFARHALRDRFVVENQFVGLRHVVCIEAIADEVVPNVATEALARAHGLHVLRPNLEVPPGMLQIDSPASGNVNNQTAVLVQYAPATHGANLTAESGTIRYQPGYPHDGENPFPMLAEPITIAEPIYATMEQVTEILATHFAGMAPRVRSTHTPVRDFDGDGKPDADDPDPYDPAK